MGKIIDTIVGSLGEKREYKANEARAKALPEEYAAAYVEIRNYIFATSGIVSMEPLKTLVDILEEASTNGKSVVEVTGANVAEFADELVRDVQSYKSSLGEKLNRKLSNKK